MARSAAGLATVALLLLATGAAGEAEPAWVADEVKIHLRRGAGTQYKIIGSVSGDEAVTVLQREDGWTNVRLESGKEGWLPSRYLASEPPAAVRLPQLETEAARLRDRIETAEADARRLREDNQALSATETEQRERIERLADQNEDMRALVRWREWVTGASILGVGMIVGAILRRSASRRRGNRVRL